MLYAGLALLPAMILLAWLYTRDKLHPVPKRAVYRLFILGAAIVLPAGLLERAMLDSGITQLHGRFTVLFITAFFVAGMVEEFLKAAIVQRAAFEKNLMKTPMDCIVYAGAAAVGFATIENILYVTSNGFSTALLRSVTAVPAHLMFGVLMGALFARSIWFQMHRVWVYIGPAIAHGVYDCFALSNVWYGDILLFVYLLVMVEQTLRRIDWAARAVPPIPI
jgi:protease PrsW